MTNQDDNETAEPEWLQQMTPEERWAHFNDEGEREWLEDPYRWAGSAPFGLMS